MEKYNELVRLENMFSVAPQSLRPGVPLAFDVFVMISGKPVRFKKVGDVIAADRIKQLESQGDARVLILNDHKDGFLKSVSDAIHDPKLEVAQRGELLKQSALVHVHELFGKDGLANAVAGAEVMVTDMVDLICSSSVSLTSLVRLSKHHYYTYNHSINVAVYSISIARKLFGEDYKMLLAAGMGGLLHDIGKRKLSVEILNKTSPLTPEEWTQVKQHPLDGWTMLGEAQCAPPDVREVVLQHHELFDGSGYPAGLSGDQISALTRVIAIADVFDALTTERSYQKALPADQALNLMQGLQPGRFDPKVFASFGVGSGGKLPISLNADFDPCSPYLEFRKR